jgi:hypothetical protein
VPDVRPYIRGSALMVAPLAIARGTQNKILEAMAMGVPVVTSSVAAGGVDAESRSTCWWPTARQDLLPLPCCASSSEPGRAPAPGHGRPRAHAQPPCLAALMQRLDGIIEPLPRGLTRGANPKTSENIA